MGDTVCVMHPFPYASVISNESKQENPMNALGESISFGRFMTESLDWEKWSSFSHKKYVEEAERYSKPGLVAQKKAFFEDHYKRIAAKKAAEALAEQENAAKDSEFMNIDPQMGVFYEHPEIKIPKKEATFNKVANENDSNARLGRSKNDESTNQLGNVENQNGISKSELKVRDLSSDQNDSLLMSKKKQAFSPLKSKVPSSPAKPIVSTHAEKENNVIKNSKTDFEDKKRSTPTFLDALISSTSKDPDPKGPRTPPPDPSASGRKTTQRKWHIFSAFCSKLQSPTEEKTAGRKQKHEEKLNTKEAQKVKLQPKLKKSEKELRKSRLSLCFKVHP